MRVDEKITEYLGEAVSPIGKQLEAIGKKFKVKPSEHDTSYNTISWYVDKKTAKKMEKEIKKKYGKEIDVYVRDMFVPDGDEWEISVEY